MDFTLCMVLGATLTGCLGGGSSSETEGLLPPGYVEVTPGAARLDGGTDPGNLVAVYAAGYKPYADSGFADTLRADRNGKFAFASLEAGAYNLLVQDTAKGIAAFLAELVVPPASSAVATAKRSAELTLPGRLRGAIVDTLPRLGQARVYLPGTPFTTTAGSDGAYAFVDIPAGTYQVNRYWRNLLPCPPPGVCGGIRQHSDSAQVKIASGLETVGPP